MSEKKTLAVLGMGWIGEHIVPCCASLLGPDYGSRMFESKKSPQRLVELRDKYPFLIIAGDSYEQLIAFQPSYIIISVKPDQVAGLTESTLAPYFRLLRQSCSPLPLLLSFAPSPTASYFTKTLGPDVQAATILPAMETHIHGWNVYALAENTVAHDPQSPLSEESQAAVEHFLRPLGFVTPCTSEEALLLVSMKICYHMLYLACFYFEERLKVQHPALTFQQSAEILRFLHRERTSPPLSSGYPLPAMKANKLPALLCSFEEAWFDGALSYVLEQGVRPSVALRSAHGSFELHALSVQLEDRDFLEKKLREHATPGGLTEAAVKEFYRNCLPLLQTASPSREDIFQCAFSLTEVVHRRGKTVAD